MIKSLILAVIGLVALIPVASVHSQQQSLTPTFVEPQRSLVVETRWLCWDDVEKSKLPDPLAELFRSAGPERVKVSGGLPVSLVQGTAMPTGGPGKPTCLIVVLEPAEVAKLMEACKSNPRNSITSAPTITMFAGQTAEMMDAALQPYVSAITTTQPVGTSTKVKRQPELICVSNGNTVAVGLGQIIGGRVDLQIKKTTCKVLDTFAIPLEEGESDDAGLQIQFPDVEMQVREFAANCELDQTMLVVLGTREIERRRQIGIPIPGTDRHFSQKTIVEKSRQLETMLVNVRELNIPK